MKSFIIFQLNSVILIVVNCSCENNIQRDRIKVLKKTDVDFSNLSMRNGRNAAFITFCHDDAVMLLPDSHPILGKKSIRKLLLSKFDTSYTLSWNPEYALVSESGELGYTYGIWTFKTEDEHGNEILKKGTYTTIWKKDANNNWKFILDSGNEGLGEEYH